MKDSAFSASPRENDKAINDITEAVIAESINIHRKLGPGLLESVYEMVLCKKLKQRGFKVESQVPVSFEFDGISFKDGFRVDILVEGIIVVELKSVEKTSPVHKKQLLTYLKLMDLPAGLLVNFGCATLKEGLQRIVNNYQDSAVSAAPREKQ